MKSVKFCSISVLILCFAGVAVAGTKDNRYLEIAGRNIFGLRSPVITLVKPSPPPRATVRLQGITDILGRKQALIAILPPPMPGTPNREFHSVLSEGESIGDIHVLEINVHAELVRIRNSEEVQTLMIAVPDVKLANGLR